LFLSRLVAAKLDAEGGEDGSGDEGEQKPEEGERGKLVLCITNPYTHFLFL